VVKGKKNKTVDAGQCGKIRKSLYSNKGDSSNVVLFHLSPLSGVDLLRVTNIRCFLLAGSPKLKLEFQDKKPQLQESLQN
jgi:hypothetical protein